MANKETTDLIIEAITSYSETLKDGEGCPEMDVMRKLVKLDDIVKGLVKKENDE